MEDLKINNKPMDYSKEIVVIDMLGNFASMALILFAFYLQFHGKFSPGGGFQSGIVMGLAFVVKDLLFLCSGGNGNKYLLRYKTSKIIAVSGVAIYATMGSVGVVTGHGFFDYIPLATSSTMARQIGVFGMEVGVGLTVFGAMSLIYRSMRDYIVENQK